MTHNPINTLPYEYYDRERKAPYAVQWGSDENGRYERRYYLSDYGHYDDETCTYVPIAFKVSRSLIDSTLWMIPSVFDDIGSEFREANARWRVGAIWQMRDHHIQIVAFDPYDENIAIVVRVDGSLESMIAEALAE